jgi:DNA repair exonuclease SbcCD ATPase subunit
MLQQCGTLNLHETRATAQAEHESATPEYKQAAKQANAIAQLRDCFVKLSSERADQLAASLRAKTADYLATMFGKGTWVSLALTGDGEGFSNLRVTRLGVASDSFSFGELSGGTQEQVAAVMRLAMAEILADGYGGCLPIVFDDAFTNSDPERIGML